MTEYQMVEHLHFETCYFTGNSFHPDCKIFKIVTFRWRLSLQCNLSFLSMLGTFSAISDRSNLAVAESQVLICRATVTDLIGCLHFTVTVTNGNGEVNHYSKVM